MVIFRCFDTHRKKHDYLQSRRGLNPRH
ncbi:hypothetical protein ECFRIK1999_5819, partial [Escherichia coli FRIK1999]